MILEDRKIISEDLQHNEYVKHKCVIIVIEHIYNISTFRLDHLIIIANHSHLTSILSELKKSRFVTQIMLFQQRKKKIIMIINNEKKNN